MPEDEIRFGVGSADAVHSSTWKMWVHNHEIYLAARHFGRFMKVSLHSTGDWRVAWIQESQIDDRQLPPGSRVLCQWRRPNEFTPGWTQCLQIMVPSSTVQHRFKSHDTGKEIVWALPPRAGEKVMFTVLLSTAQVLEETWNMVCQPGDVTLGSLALSNGERAWLMIRREPMSADEAEYVNGFVETMRIDYESDPGDVFANLTVISQERTYPTILDFALGYEHVFIQGQPSA